MVTIDMTSDTGTDLVVRYTKTADGTQDGNITFAAAALRDPNAEPGEGVNKIVERTVEVPDPAVEGLKLIKCLAHGEILLLCFFISYDVGVERYFDLN